MTKNKSYSLSSSGLVISSLLVRCQHSTHEQKFRQNNNLPGTLGDL